MRELETGIRPGLTSHPEIADAEVLRTAMFLMGSSTRSVTYLALSTFEPDEYVSKANLRHRVADLQGDADGWVPSAQTLLNCCEESLRPTEFAEFSNTSGRAKNSEVQGVRLTEKGRQLGGVVAGALLSLELQSIDELESGGRDPLFLQDVIGRTYYRKGRLLGAPTRLAIYETLLQVPPGEGLAQSELRSKVGLANSTLAWVIKDLCSLDIVRKEDDFDEKRIFNVSSDLLRMDFSLLRVIESKTVLAGMVELLKEGHVQMTCADILARAQKIQPGLARRQLSRALNGWLSHPPHAAVVQRVKTTRKACHHTQISIPDERRYYLTQLLYVQRMLTENSKAGKSFRERSEQEAKRIVSSPQQDIARLMLHAQSQARGLIPKGDAHWLDGLPSLVPSEGISMVELHRKVMERLGKNLAYRTFRSQLNRLQGTAIQIIEDTTPSRPGSPLSYVTLAVLGSAPSPSKPSEPIPISGVRVFPWDWADNAACRDTDPEVFYPIGGDTGTVTPVTQRQVSEAKAICKGCPVLLPCLKTALDVGESEAVRGGIWFKFRSQELPDGAIKRVYETVRIAED